MGNIKDNSSTTSTMSIQQKRRPLHLMSEIETMMMKQKFQDAGSQNTTGNRRTYPIHSADFEQDAATTAAAVLPSVNSGVSGAGARRPRQRRYYDTTRESGDGDNDSNLTLDFSSASSSLPSFLSHLQSSGTRGRKISASSPPSYYLKKDSFIYGGLVLLCGFMSFTIFWIDGLNYHRHYSYDLAAATAVTSSHLYPNYIDRPTYY